MKCPNCGLEMNDSGVCENCKYSIKEEQSQTEIDPENIAKGALIGFGVLLVVILFILVDSESLMNFFSYLLTGLLWIGGIAALIFAIVKFMPHVKDVVVKVGRNLLDFTTAFDVVFSAAILIAGFFTAVCAF